MRALLNVLSARGSLAVVLLAALIGSNSRATSPAAPSPPTTEPITRHWTLDGVERVATLYVPESARTRPTPVVFAFHGHGGHAEQFAGKLKLHEAWPDAIVVYPQGLNTPGRLTDRQGKAPGWQAAPAEQGDRDLKFFDAMLESLKKDYRVDDDRVYATGHSNGGTFTYVLWAARSEQIAAFAPASTALSMLIAKPDAEQINQPAKLAIRPVMHIAGENDPLVKYVWQERTINQLRKINDCDEKGEPYGANQTLYPSKIGAPVVAWVHPGKHAMPSGAATGIVKFFKQFPLKSPDAKKD